MGWSSEYPQGMRAETGEFGAGARGYSRVVNEERDRRSHGEHYPGGDEAQSPEEQYSTPPGGEPRRRRRPRRTPAPPGKHDDSAAARHGPERGRD
jgi:hypothetical protein